MARKFLWFLGSHPGHAMGECLQVVFASFASINVITHFQIDHLSVFLCETSIMVILSFYHCYSTSWIV